MANAVTVTPYLGASYSRLWMQSAQETGGGDFNFSIPHSWTHSLVTFAGADVTMPLTTTTNGTDISVIGGYRFGYDFLSDAAATKPITAEHATFGKVDLLGGHPGAARHLVSLELQGKFGDSFTGSIGANGAFTNKSWQFGAGAHLRWEF